MDEAAFNNFLSMINAYVLKQVPRDSTNSYYDEKDDRLYVRRETTAEHVFGCYRLADFFLETEPEYAHLDQLKVKDMITYHDDPEIITRDKGISDSEGRIGKEEKEATAIKILRGEFPDPIGNKLERLCIEYKERKTDEAKFCYAIDKMEAMFHELLTPRDWGPKGFTQKAVRNYFEEAFEYSKTFTAYFETMMDYLGKHGYFSNDPPEKNIHLDRMIKNHPINK